MSGVEMRKSTTTLAGAVQVHAEAVRAGVETEPGTEARRLAVDLILTTGDHMERLQGRI